MPQPGEVAQSDLKDQIIELLMTTKPAYRKATENSTAAVALATALGSQMLTDEHTAVQLALQIATDAITTISAMELRIDGYVESLRTNEMSLIEGLQAYDTIQHEVHEKHELSQERLTILFNLLSAMSTEDLEALRDNIPAQEVIEDLLPGTLDSLIDGRA